MLTTGVDAPTCKNVVLIRVINSTTEFKQIIGRGTRVRDDYGKLFFNILDYTGSATRLFADPEFDGDPDFVSETDVEADPLPPDAGDETEPPDSPTPPDGQPPLPPDTPDQPRRKFYFDGGRVEIAAHLVYELDAGGRQLRVVQFTDYTASQVRTLYASAADLQNAWADPEDRAAIIEALADRGIDFDELAESANQPDADPFDLLCHIAFNAPLRTRRERARRLQTERKDFWDQYSPEARAILDELLEKIRGPRRRAIRHARGPRGSAHLRTWKHPRNCRKVRRRRKTGRRRDEIADVALRINLDELGDHHVGPNHKFAERPWPRPFTAIEILIRRVCCCFLWRRYSMTKKLKESFGL